MLTLLRSPALFLLWGTTIGFVCLSCVENDTHVVPTVSRGVLDTQMNAPTPQTDSIVSISSQKDAAHNISQGKGGDVIATVNGHAIMRHRVVELLLRSHGPGVLEQLIVLDRVQFTCAQRGIVVVQRDIDDEYNRMLAQMADPLSGLSSVPYPREKAEQMLDAILLQRNMSREEFMIGVRLNAYLRMVVTSDDHFTEAQLQAEYAREFGRRFVVTHIQLASQAEVSRAMDQLLSGVDFSTVAKRYSANRMSAADGGLLDPFSMDDDIVPQALRDVVGHLAVGEMSQPTRIGRWYQIVRLESVIEAASVGFPGVRDQLIHRLQEKKAPEAMRKLYESLLAGAQVEVVDDTLRAAWQRKNEVDNP